MKTSRPRSGGTPGASGDGPPGAARSRGVTTPMAGVQRRPAVTRYTAEQPRKASPAAVVAKAIVATVFAATAGLCAFRAASPDATPHDSLVPVTVLTLGYTVAGVLAAVLFVVAVLWTVKGFRFADNRLVAVVWPIVTVIFIIAAGASAVPQHYVEVGFVLLPALAASIVTMVAVAWAYNHDARR